MIQAAPPAQNPVHQGLKQCSIPPRVHPSATGIVLHEGVQGALALIQSI